jgi:hypothetical protein
LFTGTNGRNVAWNGKISRGWGAVFKTSWFNVCTKGEVTGILSLFYQDLSVEKTSRVYIGDLGNGGMNN